MRQHGAVRSAAGMAPFGHLGWGYRDRAEFLCRASEYITVGLRHKQRIAYAAEGTRETLYSELATMPAIREHLDSGLIEVLPSDEYYPIIRAPMSSTPIGRWTSISRRQKMQSATATPVSAQSPMSHR